MDEARGPLPNTPGPEADKKELEAHYNRWQERAACVAYDVTIWMCLWCARTDVDLTIRQEHTRDEPMFCSEHCRNAKAAHEEKCWPKPRVSAEEIERRQAAERKRARQAESADSYGHGPVRV